MKIKTKNSDVWAMRKEDLEEFLALTKEVDIQAISIDDLLGVGAYQKIGDGLAQINVLGAITPRPDIWSALFGGGGANVETIRSQLQAAMADPMIKGILLNVDSPGGAVAGISDLAADIKAASEVKPIVTYNANMMASAGYWLGSSANKIVMGDTAQAGSIGVYARYQKDDRAKAQNGIDQFEFVSSQSPNKVPDPATDAGKAQIQARVDKLGGIFVQTVANNRGVSIEKVLNDFGKGDVLIGHDAVTAGLADAVGNYQSAVAALTALCDQKKKTTAGFSAETPAGNENSEGPEGLSNNAGGKTMTKEELMVQSPELVKALVAEGAAAESARIQGIEKLSLSGEDAKFLAPMKFDGKTSPGEAAIALISEQQARIARAGTARQEDAAHAAPVQGGETQAKTEADEIAALVDGIAEAGKKGGR